MRRRAEIVIGRRDPASASVAGASDRSWSAVHSVCLRADHRTLCSSAGPAVRRACRGVRRGPSGVDSGGSRNPSAASLLVGAHRQGELFRRPGDGRADGRCVDPTRSTFVHVRPVSRMGPAALISEVAFVSCASGGAGGRVRRRSTLARAAGPGSPDAACGDRVRGRTVRPAPRGVQIPAWRLMPVRGGRIRREERSEWADGIAPRGLRSGPQTGASRGHCSSRRAPPSQALLGGDAVGRESRRGLVRRGCGRHHGCTGRARRRGSRERLSRCPAGVHLLPAGGEPPCAAGVGCHRERGQSRRVHDPGRGHLQRLRPRVDHRVVAKAGPLCPVSGVGAGPGLSGAAARRHARWLRFQLAGTANGISAAGARDDRDWIGASGVAERGAHGGAPARRCGRRFRGINDRCCGGRHPRTT